MGQRVQLQALLEQILGSRSVYFQPPEGKSMEYPCIIYSRSSANTIFANNKLYKSQMMYTVTLIDPNPDSIILERLAALPMCVFDRHYTSNNLNHDVYNLYY